MFTDINELFSHLFKMNTSGSFVYRGIKRDIEKYPKIMRVWANRFHDLSGSESLILNEFKKYGCSLIEGNINPIELVGYAQHFGLPTRLIDWSTNPFVALFFAVNGDDYIEEGNYKLLYMDKSDLIILDEMFYPKGMFNVVGFDDSGISNYMDFIRILTMKNHLKSCYREYVTSRFQQNTGINQIIENLERKVDENRFIMMDIRYSNPRVIAQQGLFIIPKALDFYSIDDEYRKSNFNIIEIDKSLKDPILNKLINMNISKKTLFFDLINICEEITRDTISTSIAKQIDYKKE